MTEFRILRNGRKMKITSHMKNKLYDIQEIINSNKSLNMGIKYTHENNQMN